MSRSNNFRDLKTSFETRSKPTTATSTTSPFRYRFVAGDLANMPSDQAAKVVQTTAHSIDSVLDTLPATKQAIRPLAKLIPSWIGPPRPERPTTPGATTMKQHVIVEYSSPGLQPPVYIFTNLSDPQWDAVEMQTEKKDNGVYRFFKAFEVEEGEYQYKFRLGPGDWWACDENKPTVDDGSGNKNNLIVVKSEQAKALQESSDTKLEQPSASVKPSSTSLPQPAPHNNVATTADPHKDTASTPLMKHETFAPSSGSESQQTPEREVDAPLVSEQGLDDADSQVLMKHETFAPKPEDNSQATSDDDSNDSSSSDDDDDGPKESNRSPLLRHESVVPSSAEQTHAPFFRHESIAMGYNHHEPPAAKMTPVKSHKKTSNHSPVPVEADPNDSSLEKFPTDHAGIIEKIHRTATTLAEDKTSDDLEPGSPHSEALSDRSTSVASLPSVREAEDEELERIREAEEEEVEKEEASGEELDPLRPGVLPTPPLTPKEPEDADFEPKVTEKEVIQIEERIVIEVVEERKNVLETLLEKLGGRGNAIALTVGLLVVAASITTMQFL